VKEEYYIDKNGVEKYGLNNGSYHATVKGEVKRSDGAVVDTWSNVYNIATVENHVVIQKGIYLNRDYRLVGGGSVFVEIESVEYRGNFGSYVISQPKHHAEFSVPIKGTTNFNINAAEGGSSWKIAPWGTTSEWSQSCRLLGSAKLTAE
jgi:hypothetical protein